MHIFQEAGNTCQQLLCFGQLHQSLAECITRLCRLDLGFNNLQTLLLSKALDLSVVSTPSFKEAFIVADVAAACCKGCLSMSRCCPNALTGTHLHDFPGLCVTNYEWHVFSSISLSMICARRFGALEAGMIPASLSHVESFLSFWIAIASLVANASSKLMPSFSA